MARQLWLRRDYSVPKSLRFKKKTKRAIKPGESSSWKVFSLEWESSPIQSELQGTTQSHSNILTFPKLVRETAFLSTCHCQSSIPWSCRRSPSLMRPQTVRAGWQLLSQVNSQGPGARNGLLAVAASILKCHSLAASNSFYLQYELQNHRIKEVSLHKLIKAAALWDASFSPFKDLREIKLAPEERVSVVSGEQKGEWRSALRLQWQNLKFSGPALHSMCFLIPQSLEDARNHLCLEKRNKTQ